MFAKLLGRNKLTKILNKNLKRILSNPTPNMVEIFINNKRLEVPPGTTIMQAATMMGIEIPRFCYHDKLSIAGNCRMCLVEVEKMAKPVASCAMPVMNGWRIKTDSDIAKKAREGVMEFLLINHPLDCPICDQGGECDLQDQSMSHGGDRSRFTEICHSGKRGVEDKDIGPLVKTIMNRCIHCTRCVRFMNEIAGVEDLGTTGRGSDMQIGTYLEHVLESELSGNIIDVCPVGALTSKPNQFAVRPWEMKKFESIDVSDAVGCNIIVGVRTSDVMRILPQPNDAINEDWISDKTRFMYDGLKYQRLLTPMQFVSGEFKVIGWKEALTTVAREFLNRDPEHMFAVAGQMAEAESLVALRDLFHSFNSENLFTEDTDHPDVTTGIDFRASYTMNNSISDIEKSDVIVLIGICPRYEASLINARIRKSLIHNKTKVLVVGDKMNLTYPYQHVGYDSDTLVQLLKGNHVLSEILNNSQHPMLLLGTNLATSSSAPYIHQICREFSNKHSSQQSEKSWKIFNVVHRHAGYVNCLDIGYQPKLPNLKSAKFLYLLAADGGVISGEDIPSDCFVVYQGHHGDRGALLADIVLPGCAYTEKSGIYVNTEGRAQLASRCVTSPGESREDWKIIRALSDVMGNPLKYQDLDDLRQRMNEIAPHFMQFGTLQSSNFSHLISQINKVDKKYTNTLIMSRINRICDFYMTDSISRNSRTMAKCVDAITQ